MPNVNGKLTFRLTIEIMFQEADSDLETDDDDPKGEEEDENEDEDEDMEEEDESDEDNDAEEKDAGEIDDDFRNRVKTAMGKHAVVNEDSDEASHFFVFKTGPGSILLSFFLPGH